MSVRPLFLKLGGSLITDKRQTECVRQPVLTRLAREIARVRQERPDLPLVIGHGSGSFGHVHARRHGTRDGVRTAAEWLGYALTADAAARLNRAVVAALLQAELPAWSIQPGALLRGRDGRIAVGAVDNIQQALVRGVIPVLFGDVILDEQRGGTIASTEEIFEWLLPHLQPQRIVLAGEVDGIYDADPLLDATANPVAQITPENFAAIRRGVGGSYGVDVTGGMAAKVAQSIRMVESVSALDVIVCSGLHADHIPRAMLERTPQVGTRIVATS